MIHRLSIAATLAAVMGVLLGQAVSQAEPIRVLLARAKALPPAERLAAGQRLLALPETPESASPAAKLPDESPLSGFLDLRLRPMPLLPPAQPGQRLGHGDVVLSLPIRSRWQLHAGVRVDYDNRPQERSWQVEGVPTLGIGLRF